MKKFIKNQKGQSLVELLIAISLGVIVIGSAVYALSFIIFSGNLNKQRQIAVSIGEGLMNKVKALAEGDWLSIYNLPSKGEEGKYIVVFSTSSEMKIVEGLESVLEEEITDNLVAHFKFDEATTSFVYDFSFYHNNGVFSSNPPPRELNNCQVGYCLKFLGSNQNFVSFPDSDVYEFPNSSFSLGGWIYSLGGGTVLAKGGGDSGSNTEYIFHINGQGFYFKSGWRSLSSLNIPQNLWVHIFIVFDKDTNTLKVFKNKELAEIIENVSGSYASNLNYGLKIGKQGENVTNYFSGYLDDIRIYNRALSQEEIEKIYFSSLGGVYLRYFSVDNVKRDINENIVANGIEDPSTQKIEVFVKWLTRKDTYQKISFVDYVTRWQNRVFNQFDWSGGPSSRGPINEPDSYFEQASENINFFQPGQLKLNLP